MLSRLNVRDKNGHSQDTKHLMFHMMDNVLSLLLDISLNLRTTEVIMCLEKPYVEKLCCLFVLTSK